LVGLLGKWRNALLGGIGVAAAGLMYASRVEPRTLLVRHIDLAMPTLPEAMSGLRFAFLSDFHVGGPGDPLGSVNRALSALEKDPPDVIFLGGDFYDRGMRVPEEPDWSRFAAIAPTFAVPGNHDYHRDQRTTEEVLNLLDSSGIVILRNTCHHLGLSRGTIRLIGLDDPYSGRADLAHATSGLNDDVHPTIMLAHAGLVADHLPVASADLILSGHTHGAQVRFSPFRHTGALDVYWWLDFFKKSPLSPYRQGLFRVRGSMLYVGNGLGTTSLGLRFMAAPEIAMFTLVRSDGDPQRACDDPKRYELSSNSVKLTPLGASYVQSS
jgi:uncharacterized protein